MAEQPSYDHPFEVNNWSLVKQFYAAHFYLERGPFVALASLPTEHNVALAALHLQATVGPLADLPSDDAEDSDLAKEAERTQWGALGTITKDEAMQRYLEVVSQQFPDWKQWNRLAEFDVKWNLRFGPEPGPVIRRKPKTPQQWRSSTPPVVTITQRSASPLQQPLQSPPQESGLSMVTSMSAPTLPLGSYSSQVMNKQVSVQDLRFPKRNPMVQPPKPTPIKKPNNRLYAPAVTYDVFEDTNRVRSKYYTLPKVASVPAFGTNLHKNRVDSLQMVHQMLDGNCEVDGSQFVKTPPARNRNRRSRKDLMDPILDHSGSQSHMYHRSQSDDSLADGFPMESSIHNLDWMDDPTDIRTTALDIYTPNASKESFPEFGDPRYTDEISFLEHAFKSLHNNWTKCIGQDPLRFMKTSIRELNVEQFLSTVKPHLRILNSVVIQFARHLEGHCAERGDLLRLLNGHYRTYVDYLDEFLLALSVKCESAQQALNHTSESMVRFINGLEALREIKDPDNEKFNLFGAGKPTKEGFLRILQESKDYLSDRSHPFAEKAKTVLETYEHLFAEYFSRWAHMDQAMDGLKLNLESTELAAKSSQGRFLNDNATLAKMLKFIKGQITMGHDQRMKAMDVLLTTAQTALTRENDNLRKELEDVMRKYEKTLLEVRQYKEQVQRLLPRPCEDKSVACNLDAETEVQYGTGPRPVMKRISLTALLDNPEGGVAQSKSWVSAVIAQIYTDKIRCDWSDDKEGRPRQSLKSFIIEWHLQRYGLRKVAEIYLRDFVFSLRKYELQSTRLSMFAELSGLSKGQPESSIEETNALLMFIYFVRKDSVPFLPNPFIAGEKTAVVVDEALPIVTRVMTELGVDTMALEHFGEGVSKYVIAQNERDSDNEDETAAYRSANQSNRITIDLDELARMFLEEFRLYRHRSVEKLRGSFRVADIRVNGIISYDEFRDILLRAEPGHSERWIQRVYADVVQRCDSEVLHVDRFIDVMKSWLGNIYAAKPLMTGSAANRGLGELSVSDTGAEEGTAGAENVDSTGIGYGKKKKPKVDTFVYPADEPPKLDHINSIQLLQECWRICRPLVAPLEREHEAVVKAVASFRQALETKAEQNAWKSFRQIMGLVVLGPAAS
eukprot:GILK01010517.1.p1 GENE.GILK01010517.1~~GILK01010517.1.p1  ORF type:complete len:1126 (-),score=226.94 GILK01010517.1:64-3441(-)